MTKRRRWRLLGLLVIAMGALDLAAPRNAVAFDGQCIFYLCENGCAVWQGSAHFCHHSVGYDLCRDECNSTYVWCYQQDC